MNDIGMVPSGWLPGNPLSGSLSFYFLAEGSLFSIFYHCLPLCPPAYGEPRLPISPASQRHLLLCPFAPHPSTIVEREAAGGLERTLGCFWRLSEVLMLSSLQKLLADVCLLLKLHLYLQHERRERLFLKIFNWHGCTIQST